MKRILHFGPGNFFRAHMADYTFDAGGWVITGVSLRSPNIRDGLARQGFAYTLVVQERGEKRIDVIDNILVGSESPGGVLSLISSDDTKVISATVTEKGYHLTPSGELDVESGVIANELKTGKPASLIGYLAYGLAERRAPVTILSCDNRTGNGDALRKAVETFAEFSSIEIKCKVTFPNAMVDRITPATTDVLRHETGDPMAVPCEAFREWVIEDDFVSERPNWPGVAFVDDVAPHELRKLRMLNGAHSYLAYAGTLANYDFVHEAIGDPKIRQVACQIMDEASETLPAEIREDARRYAKALLARFDNKHVNHRLRQIAMDGSEKVQYRLIDTFRARKSKGLESPAISTAILAWIEFCTQEAAAGRAIEDPRGEDLAIAASSKDPVVAVLELIGARDLASSIAE